MIILMNDQYIINYIKVNYTNIDMYKGINL